MTEPKPSPFGSLPYTPNHGIRVQVSSKPYVEIESRCETLWEFQKWVLETAARLGQWGWPRDFWLDYEDHRPGPSASS